MGLQRVPGVSEAQAIIYVFHGMFLEVYRGQRFPNSHTVCFFLTLKTIQVMKDRIIIYGALIVIGLLSAITFLCCLNVVLLLNPF